MIRFHAKQFPKDSTLLTGHCGGFLFLVILKKLLVIVSKISIDVHSKCKSLLYQLAECSFKLYGWKLSWSLEGRGGMVVYCMLVSHIYCRTMYFIMEFQLNYRSTVNYLQLLPRHENSKISIHNFGMFLYRKNPEIGYKVIF